MDTLISINPAKSPSSNVDSTFEFSGKDDLSVSRPALGAATTKAAQVVTGDFERGKGPGNPSPLEQVLPCRIDGTSEITSVVKIDYGAGTTPLQIWEGEVISVDYSKEEIRAKLSAKIGSIPAHVATISYKWIQEQDRDLLKPGAVFYLTLYRERKRGGTISNAQELRFRRLPSWTPSQLQEMHSEVARLASLLGVIGKK